MNKTIISSTAVALVLGISSVASAATVDAELVGVNLITGNGASVATVAGDTSYTWDQTAGVLTAAGQWDETTFVGGATPILTESFTQQVLTLGQTGAASVTAASYECIEGIFLGIVGANGCGGYSLNAGGDNSVTEWSGLTVVQELNSDAIGDGADSNGGDDTTSGGPQTYLSSFAGMNIASDDGLGNLVINNFDSAGLGTEMTFTYVVSEVPVPAAVWLFGSGLGLLGFARRKA